MLFTLAPEDCLARTNGLGHSALAADPALAFEDRENLRNGRGVAAQPPAGGDSDDCSL